MESQRHRNWTVEEAIAIDILQSVRNGDPVTKDDIRTLDLISTKFSLQIAQLQIRGERSAWLEAWVRGLGVKGLFERDLTKLPVEVMKAIVEEPTGEMIQPGG